MREPFEVYVTLKTADEVLALREKVRELEAAAAAAQAAYNALEFRYRCECVINAELVDLCRTSGVNFRPSLLGRPYEDRVT